MIGGNIKALLQMQNGTAKSTHIFICDYFGISEQVKVENSRMMIAGLEYDVMLIDNPMNLNEHLEIYLKYTGAQ